MKYTQLCAMHGYPPVKRHIKINITQYSRSRTIPNFIYFFSLSRSFIILHIHFSSFNQRKYP
jgi:hypothetical protein